MEQVGRLLSWGGPVVPLTLDGRQEVADSVAAYAADIGDVEQAAAGTEEGLDELLRRNAEA